MAEHPSPNIEARVFEAKRALAPQLIRLRGQWVVIDLTNKTIAFSSTSRREAIRYLIDVRRGNDLHLERVGEPVTVHL